MTQAHIRRAARPGAVERVAIGRAITLGAAAIFCISRALAYAPWTNPPLVGPIRLLSADGEYLWAWAAAWAIAAILCIADLLRGHTRYGLSLMVGLLAVWGASYGIVWAMTEAHTREWLTAATLLPSAGVIYGLLYKITALRDLLDAQADREAARD